MMTSSIKQQNQHHSSVTLSFISIQGVKTLNEIVSMMQIRIITFIWFNSLPVIFAFMARRSPPWALQFLRRRNLDIVGDTYLIVCGTPPSTSLTNKDTDKDVDGPDIQNSQQIEKSQCTKKINNDNNHVQSMYNIKHPFRYDVDDSISKDHHRNILQVIGPLFRMTRPGNFPIVVLFHIVGIRSALTRIDPFASPSLIFALALHPSLMVTLLAIILISAASMVVNDYYDTRLGVDKRIVTPFYDRPMSSLSSASSSSITVDRKPLVSGEVSLTTAKEFLYYLYSGLLFSLAFIPGIPTRLSVVTATILTFIYTTHLKPRTWIKNISCAVLMALSPFTSGAATLYTMVTDDQIRTLLESASFTTVPQGLGDILYILMTSLGPLVLTLFCGFMAREIVMDIHDYESDKASCIMTIPVRHGRRMATHVALGFVIAMCISACAEPLWSVVNINWNEYRPQLFESNQTFMKWTQTLWNILSAPAVMKLCLSASGSLWMIIRLLQVRRSEGEDKRVLDRFIEEGKGAILFLLTSFALK